MKLYVWMTCIFITSSGLVGQANNDISSLIVPLIDEIKEKKDVPGMAVGVIYGDQIITYTPGFADLSTREPVTEETIFQLASITKAFTGVLVARAVLDGKMRLDDPVSYYFPRLRRRSIGKVTIQQLATHTSGLPRKPRFKRRRKVTRRALMNYFRKWAPGERPVQMQYSNIGYGLLAFCLENAYGKDYMSIMHELLLEPLGMKSTFIKVPPGLEDRVAQGYKKNGAQAPRGLPASAWPASGALRSSLRDMILFAMANLGIARIDPSLGIGVIDEDVYKAMKLSHQGFYYGNNPNRQVTLGWFRITKRGTTIVDKNGGLAGSSTYIGLAPDKQLAIVILINKGGMGTTGMGRGLLFGLAKSLS